MLTIEQRVHSGHDFDGTEPAGEPVRRFGIQAFPIQNAGGLFDFDIVQPHYIRCIELKLGGQSSWTVYKRDLGGTELLLCTGTNETDFVTVEAESMLITPGQVLLVRTFGAGVPLMARITVELGE